MVVAALFNAVDDLTYEGIGNGSHYHSDRFSLLRNQSARYGAGSITRFAGNFLDLFGSAAANQRTILQGSGNGGKGNVSLPGDIFNGGRTVHGIGRYVLHTFAEQQTYCNSTPSRMSMAGNMFSLTANIREIPGRWRLTFPLNHRQFPIDQ